MTVQENGDLLIQVTAWEGLTVFGDCMGRFDCIWCLVLMWHVVFEVKILKYTNVKKHKDHKKCK
jgi:hypothetical protein